MALKKKHWDQKDLQNLWTAKTVKTMKTAKTMKTMRLNRKKRRISPQLLFNPHIFYFSSLSLFSPPNTLNNISPTQLLSLPPKPPHLQFYIAILAVFTFLKIAGSKDFGSPFWKI